MSRLFQRGVFVLSVAVFVTLGMGFALSEFGYLGVLAGQQESAYKQVGVFQNVLKKIQSDYVTEPNMADVTTGALHGLIESLDSDSSYLSATEYKIYKERPTTGVAQVGITVSKRFGYATVVSVAPGSPADKAHVADGDLIEYVAEQSTRELSLAVIRLLLEGKPGSTVTLSVVRARKPDPEKVMLTRALLTEPALAQQAYENGSILYLKPGSLTTARVDEIATQIKSAGPTKKILLDLRDSASGDAKEGLRLANFFVKQGTLATLEGQKFPKQTFAADPALLLTAAPLEVLVNRGTYGPAELTAAAIADNKRGDLVGERTFGEGAVQKTIELQNGAAILLTVAKYQTPAGKKLLDEAVTPTVVVGPNPDDAEDEEAAPAAKGDAILAKGLELLKAKSN